MGEDMIFWDDMWNGSSKDKPSLETNNMQLTYSRLNGEYLNWSLENGDGRNSDDLRFGQYLDSKYIISKEWMDIVFYNESCEGVYSELLKLLYKLEE